MSQAPAEVEGHVPKGWNPARAQGERALARRRQPAAYIQLAPGGIYMVRGFVLPLIIISTRRCRPRAVHHRRTSVFSWE